VQQPHQELAMIGILDLFLLYCSAATHTCVQVPEPVQPPLTQFSQCESAGRTGDSTFQHEHPDWKLRAFTCAMRPEISA
jgi:hypothetical protein